ncbi:peptidylprolyl isomerase [Nocardioides sp.]|uniref:peptidylprolyl isomerase n=1 Tax=Nocardioides sp. TaxID=35761 RepID=UPI00261612E7|nr:peptidylprolyl isomerase [Nocardioides sp.]MCW2736593.1 Peptidyl-prolyl cis-trans isomerase (Rotamase)-cyclophilin family [Nocardioides sp.]
MSSSKQRKARQKAEREQWEREQARLAEGRRRRRLLLGALATVVAASVIAVVVALTTGDSPDPSADEPPAGDVELDPEEAAGEAQAAAANEARAAGDVLAEDYTVEPGTPVDSGAKPPRDDRPVACGAKTPANARATRPRYPGGPADVLRDGVDYVARIETSCGPITIDLLEKDAPVAVNSFVFLAGEGFYDGLDFFRDFGGIAAAQAGSGDNTVRWDIGYTLPDELDAAEREGYPIGTVTTAGEGAYTAGSDFYIAYGKEFAAGFETNRIQTTFGRVLSGMDVINTVTAMDRLGMGGEVYAERLFMESVTIQER